MEKDPISIAVYIFVAATTVLWVYPMAMSISRPGAFLNVLAFVLQAF